MPLNFRHTLSLVVGWREISNCSDAPPPDPRLHRRRPHRDQFIAFAAFGLDKAKARRGAYRIAESTLLLFAFLGGTLGAYAGRSLFRHKTHKQPFNSNLFTIAVVQVLALIGWRFRG